MAGLSCRRYLRQRCRLRLDMLSVEGASCGGDFTATCRPLAAKRLRFGPVHQVFCAPRIVRLGRVAVRRPRCRVRCQPATSADQSGRLFSKARYDRVVPLSRMAMLQPGIVPGFRDRPAPAHASSDHAVLPAIPIGLHGLASMRANLLMLHIDHDQ